MVGEHIRTRREGHWTHGIDCGDETVIHLVQEAPGSARVRRSYRPLFVSGAEAVEVVTHRQRTFPADEIVARAYSRIADPGLAAMFRDSEAFAEWCATGRLPPGPANVAVGLAVASSASPSAAAREPAAPASPAKARPAASPRPRAKPAPKARKSSKRAPVSKARSAAPRRAAKKASAPARKKGAKAKRARR
jgi:lecithin:retinol acyltransferase